MPSLSSSSRSQLEESLGRSKHAGSELIFNCPFCSEAGSADTKYHFYLNTEKSVWVCHRCGERGTVRGLFKKLGLLQDDEDFGPPTDERLAQELKALIDPSPGEEFEPFMYPVPVESIVIGSLAFEYLRERNVSAEKIENYRLVTGNFKGPRIFVPTYSPAGMCYWVARSILATSSAKYLNPKKGKDTSVFNLHRQKGDVIICEGVFSAIAAGETAVAIFGKSATDFQMKALLKAPVSSYTVCLDGDAEIAGIHLAMNLLISGKPVFFVPLPKGDDPASVGEEWYSYLAAKQPVKALSELAIRMGELSWKAAARKNPVLESLM